MMGFVFNTEENIVGKRQGFRVSVEGIRQIGRQTDRQTDRK